MVEIIDSEDYEIDKKIVPDAYDEFRQQENIPIHTGLYIRDLDEVETDSWDRTGQRGALINLYGMEGINDLQIHEIAPREETTQQRHFYHEIVYVLKGSGITTIGEGDSARQFEWSKHSMFAIPRNTTYAHKNMSGEDDVKLVVQTDLPQLIDIIRDEEFIFNSEYDFWGDRDVESVYSDEGTVGTMYADKPLLTDDDEANAPVTWETNFVPDITDFNQFDKDDWNNLGAMKIMRIPFPVHNTYVHLSEIPVGKYKNAHRHNPGANVFIHTGEGYALMWDDELEEQNQKVRLDWGPRSVYTPPGGWWHHHFNVGSEPAGQFAMHAPPIGTMNARDHIFDPHSQRNTILYHQEDEHTRELYKSEIEKSGVEFDMPEETYTDPEFKYNRNQS